MTVYDLILKRRSIRRFHQERIFYSILEKLVNAARLAPSAANLQPLEYIVVDDPGICAQIFPNLRWAAYIAPRGTPPEGKRPTAYIIVLVNKKIKARDYERDVGAAVENILLAALEKGIGTCWIQSIEKEGLRRILKVPASYEIDSVVALGYKVEDPVVEEMTNSVKYWLDDQETLHVPKRKLEDVLHRNKFSHLK
jgi:nitroreductase